MTFQNLAQAREAFTHFIRTPNSHYNANTSRHFAADAIEFITKPTTETMDKLILLQEILTYFYQPSVKAFLASYKQTDLDDGVLGVQQGVDRKQINDLYNNAGTFINYNLQMLELVLACASIYIPPLCSGALVENNKKLFSVLFAYFIDQSLTNAMLNTCNSSIILAAIYTEVFHDGHAEMDKCSVLLGLLKTANPQSSMIRPISSNNLQTNQTSMTNLNVSFLGKFLQNSIIENVIKYHKIDMNRLERAAHSPITALLSPTSTPLAATRSLAGKLPRNNESSSNLGFYGTSGTNHKNLNNNDSKKRPHEGDNDQTLRQ